jgi:HSP20 family protein
MRTPIKRSHDLWGGLIENMISDSQNLKKEFKNFLSMPAVNIKNNADAFEIELAAPGLKKEDFNIEVEEDLLKLSVEKKQESEENSENYTRKEFNYSSFHRSFTLPKNIVDKDQVRAVYVDGILKVSIPKLQEAKETKIKIAVD